MVKSTAVKKTPAKKPPAEQTQAKKTAPKAAASKAAEPSPQPVSAKEAERRERATEQLQQADRALATVQKREARLSQKLSFDAQRARNVKRSIRSAELDLEKLGNLLEEVREVRKEAKKRLKGLRA